MPGLLGLLVAGMFAATMSMVQTRSFCYVDDLIDGMFRLMNNDRGLVGPVNVGNPNEFTMLELAEHVIRLTRSESRLVKRPLPSDDPRQRQPDISLAREALDWQPRVELEAGLARTIEYFRGLLSGGWRPEAN